MNQYLQDNKNTILYLGMMIISFLFYWLALSGNMVISLAFIISAASYIVLLSTKSKVNIILCAVQIAFLLILGTFMSDIINAVLFTALSASVGIICGTGIADKQDFSEYMLRSIIIASVITVISAIYDLYCNEIAITMDNAIDYYISPAKQFLEIYAQNDETAGTADEIFSMVRWMAIGIFFASVILQVFLSYALAGGINVKAKFSEHKFFGSLKTFSISKFGCIVFIACAIIDLCTDEGYINLFAQTMHIILRYPMALCGIITAYNILTAYKAKPRTTHIAIAVISILAVIPIFNVATGLAFIGALDCLLSISTPKQPKKKTM